MLSRAAGKFLLLATSLLPCLLKAQSTLPQPVLNTIYPCAAQVGTTAEVVITGTALDGATKLHFSVKGIECKAGAKPNTFVLTIAPDAPAGYCDVRVVARYGISNPRGFAITKLPVAELKERTLQASVGQVLMGRTTKQDHNTVTFEAKKGEALQILCKPAQLDSRMEPVVTVRNANGTVLARMDAEGTLRFTPPADGSYAIELQDLMFRGDAEYPFVLALSKPDASGLEKAPALQPLEKREMDLSKPLPVETTYTGWFPARSKSRLFTFTAKKGDVRIIEVKSARLGLNADPYLIVEKLDGSGNATFIAEANDRTAIAAKDEFDGGWADPSYRFEAKEDGTYRLKLRNLFPTQVPFELSVQPPGTAFELVALPSEVAQAKKTTAAILAAPLWRGGVTTFKVIALRERGFTGPIALSAEGLPPGVTSLGGLIAAGTDIGFISFSADDQAAPWGGAVRILGTHGEVSKVARGATVVRAIADTAKAPVLTRLTPEVALGVVPSEAPLLIAPGAPLYEVTTTGKLDIPVTLTRRAEFADAVKLTALGLGSATPLAIDVPAKGTAGALKGEVAKLKLAPGDYPVVLQTAVKFKHKVGEDPKAKPKDLTATVHSKPFLLRVKPEVKSDVKPEVKK